MKYSKCSIPEEKMTGNQRILSQFQSFGQYLDILDGQELSLHEWAGAIKSDRPFWNTKEAQFGFIILRMLEEGLIEMSCCKKPLISFKKLHDKAQLPIYKTPGAAGMDVYSVEEKTIGPGGTGIVSLGFAMEIPDGWEVQIRPRSGLAAKHDVTVLNSPGTIDSDYRGVVQVILHNSGIKAFEVKVWDRIAQFVVKRAPQATVEWVYDLSTTERNDGGLGSTGVK